MNYARRRRMVLKDYCAAPPPLCAQASGVAVRGAPVPSNCCYTEPPSIRSDSARVAAAWPFRNMKFNSMLSVSSRLFLAIVVAILGATAHAGSLVASSADAGVEGSRGSSNSVKLSSNSSADDQTVAIRDGIYRVARVDAAADGSALRLTLNAQGEPAGVQDLQLDIPRPAFAGVQPRVGELLQVQRRDHGVRFARGAEHEPFFLVVADAVTAELDARPLTP